MTNHQTSHDPSTDATDHEQFSEPAADRPPTDAEERAAEKSAGDVDIDEVGEHYEDAMELGANVKGEGQIEPDRA